MGHRANYVIIRDGIAEAFRSQWGATHCLDLLSEGPEPAEASARDAEPVKELLNWCYAEGGYLLDFDERLCMAFGHLPDPTNEADDWETRLRAFGPIYLPRIAPAWPGWRLVLDDHGVDTFVEHLSRRGITSIRAGERGGESSAIFEHQA